MHVVNIKPLLSAKAKLIPCQPSERRANPTCNPVTSITPCAVTMNVMDLNLDVSF
jgi:hypothetical protein